ncbi:hypothetical protein RM553_19160, partial [Zunongwangia sp. F363]
NCKLHYYQFAIYKFTHKFYFSIRIIFFFFSIAYTVTVQKIPLLTMQKISVANKIFEVQILSISFKSIVIVSCASHSPLSI